MLNKTSKGAAKILRSFAGRKLVKSAEVESDATLKTYFNEKLESWTKAYHTHKSKQKSHLESKLSPEERERLRQVAQALIDLPPEQRWLVGEYKDRGSLSYFVNENTLSSVSSSSTNLEHYTQLPGFEMNWLGRVGGAPSSGSGSSTSSGAKEKGKDKKEAAPEAPKAEKTNFDVVLLGYEAADKIKVIKEVRTALNLGLKEAKDLVEKLPAKLATGIPKKDADALLEKLKPSGGKIELA